MIKKIPTGPIPMYDIDPKLTENVPSIGDIPSSISPSGNLQTPNKLLKNLTSGKAPNSASKPEPKPEKSSKMWLWIGGALAVAVGLYLWFK